MSSNLKTYLYKYFIPFLFVVILTHQPFLFISFVHRPSRLIVEAFTLVLFFAISYKNRQLNNTPLILIFISLFILYLGNNDPVKEYFAVFNKLFFWAMLPCFLRFVPKSTEKLITFWKYLWVIICLWTLFGFILYISFPDNYKLIQFIRIDKNANYHYYLSDFGNMLFLTKSLFSFHSPRMIGVFFEPNQLGFFAWLNLLCYKLFFTKKRTQYVFVSLTVITGLLSGSIAFFAIFLIFFPIFIIREFTCVKLKPFVISWMIFMSFVVLIKRNYIIESSSSLDNRVERYVTAYKVLKHSNLKTLLFGSGLNSAFKYSDKAFTSAYTDLLATKGLFVFISVFYLLFQLIKFDKILLYSVLVYLLSANPFKYQAFFLLLTFFYLDQYNKYKDNFNEFSTI